MLKITTYNRTAIRMLRESSNRAHRKRHLERAQVMRDEADKAYEAGFINENMKLEVYAMALQEENLKCMDKH